MGVTRTVLDRYVGAKEWPLLTWGGRATGCTRDQLTKSSAAFREGSRDRQRAHMQYNRTDRVTGVGGLGFYRFGQVKPSQSGWANYDGGAVDLHVQIDGCSTRSSDGEAGVKFFGSRV